MTISADSFTQALPPLEHPLEDGWTLPASWYSRRSGRRARARADLRPLLAVRRAGRVRRRAGLVLRRRRSGTSRSSSRAPGTASCAAFVNVCRHRAYVIAREHGCRETLQCPYHAWTYDLDGSLRKAPRSEREEDFDPENFSLLPVVGRHVGAVPLRQSRSRRRSARGDARRPAEHRRGQRPRLRRSCSSTRTVSGRSRRTGRSRSRTTSSATTAPPPTPASAR